MTKWLKRTAIAVVLIGMTPVPARADFWDVIKWLNDMSGPQMLGFVYEQTVWCRYDSGDHKMFLACTPFKFEKGARTTDQRSLTLGARVGRAWNTKKESNGVAPDISMFVVGPSVRWSPSGARYFDVSAGVELVRFYGPTVDAFWVPTADIGVGFKPFVALKRDSRLSHIYTIGVTYKQFMETFGGDRFGARDPFLSKTEGIWQVSFARFDLSALIFR